MVKTPMNQQQQPVQTQQFVTPPQPNTRHVSYKTEFRCSPTTGRQWQVQVPVDDPPAPTVQAAQLSYEWRIHPHTGVSYQVQVPIQPPECPIQQPVAPRRLSPGHVHSQPYQSLPHGYQQCQGPSPNISHDKSQQMQQSLVQTNDQSGNTTLSRQERVAGIVSLLDGGVTKKQPKILEHAKKCPTKWSKQATMSTMNLPLYAWGVIEELEAAMSGRSQALQEGVMLGKLRHLKNTLEVCCLNSNYNDFTGFGWTLAKDYASKVNDEIEQGRATWQDMPMEVKTAPLLSANMENPRPIQSAKYEPKGPKNAEQKDTCTTYNKCTTVGKCEYEVSNPDKTCLKKHECSWCKTNKKQSWKHQAWRCKNKESS